jgi:hypothetical protein
VDAPKIAARGLENGGSIARVDKEVKDHIKCYRIHLKMGCIPSEKRKSLVTSTLLLNQNRIEDIFWHTLNTGNSNSKTTLQNASA